MASTVTYTCDCCRNRIEPDAQQGDTHYGFALRWSAADTLEEVSIWRDSPVQFCAKCIRVLGHFRDFAAESKRLPK